MKATLPLFIFIDALGWEILKPEPFARGQAPYRHRLTSVFGYSSACVPSIVSGSWPAQHRNWCYFVYDPLHSPFHSLRSLQWLPTAITSRRVFRRWLSKFVKVQLRFRGYFDLYNIPFRHISLFDFTEKKSPLRPGGMNRGANIFDYLVMHNIAYHAGDPTRGETDNLNALTEAIRAESIDFAFVYWPEMDGLLHRVGNQSSEVSAKLLVYEQRLERLLSFAAKHYDEIRLYIFGDHGMANCREFLDLRQRVDALKLRMGKDYVVVYDSTMARFWFFNEHARAEVTQLLNRLPQGRIIPDHELEEMHVFFPDRYFGELIFLVNEGVLIVPSHMGERPIRAMHGYHPTAPQSYAALLTNQLHLPAEVNAIPDIFHLMKHDAELAKARNAVPPASSPALPRKKAAPPAPAPVAAAPVVTD